MTDNQINKKLMQVENLSFEYDSGGFALKDISVDFVKGEKVAVIGSNGSGKSTFFLNLNGVLHSHRGKIIYDGAEINKKNLNMLRSKVGIVFQEPDSQLIASTVEAEVSFGPLNLGLTEEETEQRVAEALREMNIEELKEKMVHYLSGGEKKRVSIADIIAMKPEIIIFDEPTASLDPLNCDMFEQTLKKMDDKNITVIISTHDIDFVWKWAERAIVFHDGKIIADGAPEQIFMDDELLKKTHLKKPAILEICIILQEKNIVQNNQYVKSVSEFREMFK